MQKNDESQTNNSEQMLVAIAQEFLTSETNPATAHEINSAFQNEIRNLYHKIKPLTDRSDAQGILDDLAQRFKPTETTPQVPITARMFPKLYLEHLQTDGSMECTLASAMYKLALEEQGFDNVRTVLTRGHQLTSQELQDGSIRLSDPSTRWTDENQTQHGFSETFTQEEIIGKKEVYDADGKLRGYSFTIKTARQIKHTGLFENRDEVTGLAQRKFFASEPDILIELSIALDNLGNLENKSEYAVLKELDATQLTENLGIFSPKFEYWN